MSKMSELDLVLAELKKCGESLISVSEGLRDIFSGPGGENEAAKAEKPGKAKAAAKREPVSVPGKEEAVPEGKAYSLTEVRALLAEKSRAGYTSEVREMLQKHGAEKLSGIDPSEYAALVAEVEVLGNG